MSERTWTLKVSESEMNALIQHNLLKHCNELDEGKATTETSMRIHDLTKRLNKETADIVEEVKNNTPATAAWPS